MSQANAAGKRARRGAAKLVRERALRHRARVRRVRTTAVAFAVLAAVVGVGLVIVRTGSGGVGFAGDFRVGGRIDRLTLPKLQGDGTIEYAQFSDRPMVLNFFASWCPFCIAEMPDFEQVHQELGDRVVFLGVSQSDARGASIDLVHETGITYPAGFDQQGAFFNAVGTTGMPTTLFIEPGGTIAYIQVGPLDPAGLKQLIGEHLGVSA